MISKFPALFFSVLWISITNAAENNRPESTYSPAAEAAPASARAPVLIAGSVTRALFTRRVKDLEPVDTVSVLTNDITHITYFTEIHGMAGQTITHRWEYNGKILLEKKHEVGSSHWRAYTSKNSTPRCSAMESFRGGCRRRHAQREHLHVYEEIRNRRRASFGAELTARGNHVLPSGFAGDLHHSLQHILAAGNGCGGICAVRSGTLAARRAGGAGARAVTK
jgi:hypothetical protein